MINRYNIALIPSSKTSAFIDFTEKLYGIAGKYRIGDGSIPHVTLCQFLAPENEVGMIWNKVYKSSANHSIELDLHQFSCITIDNSNWVSLLPNNLDSLMQMHTSIANLIPSRIGRCFEKYDAHMTLINTQLKNYEAQISSLPFQPIKDEFILALGKTDELGQLVEIMYRHELQLNTLSTR